MEWRADNENSLILPGPTIPLHHSQQFRVFFLFLKMQLVERKKADTSLAVDERTWGWRNGHMLCERYVSCFFLTVGLGEKKVY